MGHVIPLSHEVNVVISLHVSWLGPIADLLLYRFSTVRLHACGVLAEHLRMHTCMFLALVNVVYWDNVYL